MSRYGITLTVLATGLVEAMGKDEQFALNNPDHRYAGFDISAGLFGVEVYNWLKEVAGTISETNKTPVEENLK